MNIRSYIEKSGRYFEYNREERNLAAIFYHALLLEGNLEIFLQKLGHPFPVLKSELAIYYEYAYLRDLWFKIGDDNETKRALILDTLNPNNKDTLHNLSIFEFNHYFGAAPQPSSKFIQSPGNWSISSFDANIKSNDEFIKASKFKWCFNAKPDIVIHTSNNSAICIEAKLESEEGKYPSSKADRTSFSPAFSLAPSVSNPSCP